MPNYDYLCSKCDILVEIMHMMSDDSIRPCPDCGEKMDKQISGGYLASSGFKPTLADLRETDHHLKVKDPERAVKMRKKAFGHDAVGDPVDTPDPMHIVKRGRTLAGQEKEVDKAEVVKALAKDPCSVDIALKSLKKSNSN